MKTLKILSCSILALVFGLAACEEIVTYPNTPQIEFEQVEVKDSVDLLGNRYKSVDLQFHLIDGDGNVGLQEGDSLFVSEDSVLYNNFFASDYKKENGEFVLVEALLKRSYRLPYIEIQGQNKTLDATVNIRFEYQYGGDFELPYDTFRYDFFVIDRELNKSNVILTPEIVFQDTIIRAE